MMLWTHGVRDRAHHARSCSSRCCRPTRRASTGCSRARALIAPGADADIVVWDPELPTHRHPRPTATARRLHAVRGHDARRRARARCTCAATLAYVDGEVLAPSPAPGEFVPRSLGAAPAGGGRRVTATSTRRSRSAGLRELRRS